MAEIRLRTDEAGLMVVHPGGASWPIHPLWLRERCSDPGNLDVATKQRIYNPSDLDAALGIISASAIGSGDFEIVFSDGSTGAFRGSDIIAEIPSAQAPFDVAPIAWTAGNAPPAPVDWPSCADDVHLLTALSAFLHYGYTVFHNVPTIPGAVLQVARRFGYPRETNFGELFDVRSTPGANDLAYTAVPLGPHTDNPYRRPVPGTQLLHCLTNDTPGGLSTLVDGLAVAEALRAADSEAFDCLCSVAVRFQYKAADTELTARAPLIELDSHGTFTAMNYSPRLDFVPLLPPGDLERFFAARRLLSRMLTSTHFERRFKLSAGDLIMFDNRRLLHGRTGFDPHAGARHLQGCYIDSDGPSSQHRVLCRLPA